MIIEVKTGVFWDTETTIQSEEAIQWLQEDVRPNLSAPTMDEFQRPYERTFFNETVTVIERQVYINQNYDWGRKGVQYIVTLNSEEHEGV